LKILIAEDDPVSRRLLQAFLTKWGYEVVLAGDGAETCRLLEGDRGLRLAILDWMMPELDGIEVCRRIRRRHSEPYVYLLLLTARNSKKDLVAGLEAGADDYLAKPFDPGELWARIHAGRRILEMQEELVAAREALQYQATRDFLTGLFNRAEMLELLQRELVRGQRERKPLGVILADLDYFKCINDTHGHFVGDEVLREAARRLGASVRSYDAVGRYGGEEFLLVMPGSDRVQTQKQAERLRAAIARAPVETTAGAVALTVSLGIASTSEAPEANADTLLRAADAMLYRAKQAGRDRVEAATPADISRFLSGLRPETGPCARRKHDLTASV